MSQLAKECVYVDVDTNEIKDDESFEPATYKRIREYILEKHGVKVSTLYIAQVKRKYGIGMNEYYGPEAKEGSKQPQCPPEKEELIVEALKHFKAL